MGSVRTVRINTSHTAREDATVRAFHAAALAAGGVVVQDSDPSYVVIADPDGNKACVTRYPHPA